MKDHGLLLPDEVEDMRPELRPVSFNVPVARPDTEPVPLTELLGVGEALGTPLLKSAEESEAEDGSLAGVEVEGGTKPAFWEEGLGSDSEGDGGGSCLG